MSEFYKQLFCENNQHYSVIVEDDGRVAYAYLLSENSIVGDVWLYNQLPSPNEVNWKDNTGLPFLNPKEFTDYEIEPILTVDDIDLEWILSNIKELQEVNICIHQKLLAKLSLGSKPGWSCIVIKSGPLALIYE